MLRRAVIRFSGLGAVRVGATGGRLVAVVAGVLVLLFLLHVWPTRFEYRVERG